MPGRAIGSTNMSETASRPKNRNRWIPKATRVPSTSAIAVATTPALIESQKALRTAGSFHATENHDVVQCWIGNVWTLDLSKAKTVITTSGTIKKPMTSTTKMPNTTRVTRESLIVRRRPRPGEPGGDRRP